MLSFVALASQAQLVGIPGASGAINPQAGQFYPNAGAGSVVNPQTGQYHPYDDSKSNGAANRRYQPDLPQGMYAYHFRANWRAVSLDALPRLTCQSCCSAEIHAV